MTVASICYTLRHLDVSADTAVDFPTEELFSARMMSLRAHITQAFVLTSLQILWLLKVENAHVNYTNR